MEEYKQIGKQKLRMGYTTGSCAAAAAKAAAQMLFSGVPIDRIGLMTPKGIALDLAVEDVRFSRKDEAAPEDFCMEEGRDEAGLAASERITWVSCAVRKDAGDDPDVTNGVLVYAKVCFGDSDGKKILIDGGVGIGRVTKKGLEQPVGAAAINRVPRQMIREAVEEICEEQEYDGCLDVIISIPAGVELAQKTFNPNLGIEGGISVLGTSGIVEPMSEDALKESIRVELKMLVENFGKNLIFTPGNYGMHYLRDRWPEFAGEEIPCLKFSNYVGDVLQFALEMELESILFVAHIGKFVKVAGGIMNTHSKEADARVEIMASAALRAGVSAEIAREILDCTTTDAAIDVLKKEDELQNAAGTIKGGLTERTMQIISDKALYHLRRKTEGIEIGLVLFSNAHGTLAESENVDVLLEKITGR